jgi:hypothetical protein
MSFFLSLLQCKGRFSKKLDPNVNHEVFTPAEDQKIIDAHSKGLPWPKIAALLAGRSSGQVRHRFINQIDPSLKKGVPWSAQEDTIMHAAQQELGNRWTEIATRLPGRSENDVKNRWHNAKHSHARRMKRAADGKEKPNGIDRPIKTEFANE